LSVTFGQAVHERPGASPGHDPEDGREGRLGRYLAENGIRYEHEVVAAKDAQVFKRIFAKPDFYLPDYGVYVEYWGMAHAGPEYARQMRRRMAAYNARSIRFISIFPEDLGRLGLVFRARFREVAGFELPHAVSRSDVLLCSRCGTAPAADVSYCAKCQRHLV
jgi:hypothetical protein